MNKFAESIGYFTLALLSTLAVASFLLAFSIWIYSASAHLFATLRYLVGLLP